VNDVHLLTVRVPSGVSAILVTRDAMLKSEENLIKGNISALGREMITFNESHDYCILKNKPLVQFNGTV
jgi:hypothetical protein